MRLIYIGTYQKARINTSGQISVIPNWNFSGILGRIPRILNHHLRYLRWPRLKPIVIRCYKLPRIYCFTHFKGHFSPWDLLGSQAYRSLGFTQGIYNVWVREGHYSNLHFPVLLCRGVDPKLYSTSKGKSKLKGIEITCFSLQLLIAVIISSWWWPSPEHPSFEF